MTRVSQCSTMEALTVIVVGATKAGTTTLESIIRNQNSSVRIGPRTPLFGDRTDLEARLQAVETINTTDRKILYHICTSYMNDRSAVEAISRATKAKIVLVCRDPAKRLWAHYFHDFKKGRSHTQYGFDRWLASQRGQFAAKLSEYGRSLQLLHEFFPRDRVHVVLTQDLNDLSKLNGHLTNIGLQKVSATPTPLNVSRMPRCPFAMRLANRIIEPLPHGKLKRRLISFRDKRLRTNRKAPTIPDNVRHDLIMRYRDDILLFSELSGRDVQQWLQ